MNDGSNALILHLGELEKNKDRGALAALRKGLGKAPGSVPEMFEHVIPYMDRDATMAQ
jgi:CRISPR system Cascade subunit CasB